MNITHVDVRPMKTADGKFTLHETTHYDERVPGMPWLQKSRRRLWPLAKQPNKRGRRFDTYKEAVRYFAENKDDDMKYGRLTRELMERHIGN